MANLRIRLLGLLLVFPAAGLGAPATLAHLASLAETSHHSLPGVDGESVFHVYVRPPENVDSQDRRFPVIVLLDGDSTFPLLASYYRYLQVARRVPPAIVVGLSYGTFDPRQGNHRARDFTAATDERAFWGGAPDFARWLSASLFPLLESSYGADPKRRVLFGQSLGGQFAIYAAMHHPDLFHGHIASNPALHRNLDFFLQSRGKRVQNQPLLFVSRAEHDQPRFNDPSLRWVTHWQSQSDPPFQLQVIELADHDHFTAAPEAFRRGLTWIFGHE